MARPSRRRLNHGGATAKVDGALLRGRTSIHLSHLRQDSRRLLINKARICRTIVPCWRRGQSGVETCPSPIHLSTYLQYLSTFHRYSLRREGTKASPPQCTLTHSLIFVCPPSPSTSCFLPVASDKARQYRGGSRNTVGALWKGAVSPRIPVGLGRNVCGPSVTLICILAD